MRAKSHRLLGEALVQQYFTGLPRSYIRMFLAGCVQPDKNPATYLKGSLRQSFLRGHNFSNAKRYMCRILSRLEQPRRWNHLDYYTLGKLIHYTADAFTAAHADRFDGNLLQHRQYECQLHRYFQGHLALHHGKWHCVYPSVMKNICYYHRQYRKLPPSVSTDTDYCIGVSSLIVGMLTARQTAAKAPAL